MNEFERIRRLRALFGEPPDGVSLGIGDDAAVLDVPAGRKLVWTIDDCVEDVHFSRRIASWWDVGYRSLMAAASDVAAMAAEPLGVLSALGLPKDLSDEAVDGIAQGQDAAARAIGTAVIGGNLSAASIVTVTTTVLGHTSRAPRRDGANAGDVVAVCGAVGLAAAGLRLLLDSPSTDSFTEAQWAAVEAWRHPMARIAEGVRCRGIASSLIDVSDGLAQDAGHVADASRVRIDLDPVVLVTDALLEAAGSESVSLVLHGGEDYALLGTFRPGEVPDGFLVVGRCVEGDGVWVNDVRVDCRGHDHFR